MLVELQNFLILIYFHDATAGFVQYTGLTADTYSKVFESTCLVIEAEIDNFFDSL